MSGYLCVGECQHYIEQDIYINKLKQEIEELRAENKRLAKRDCNATVKLSYETKEYPFNTEELKILDIGVLDNTYIVESKLFNDLQQQLADKDKVVQVLAEQVFKYAKWFGIKFEGGEVSEKYIIERATKQAEQ